jgi:hypothetical protein
MNHLKQMKTIPWLLVLSLLLLQNFGCNDPSAKQQAAPGSPTASNPADASADEGALNLIDLSVFPRLEGAINPEMKSATMIMYTAPGKPLAAYETIKKQLLAERWRELPGANISAEYGYANGNFAHHGYLLGISVYKDDRQKPEGVSVTMIHHGQVDWKKLPLPADAKQDYALAATAGYVTESSVEDTIKNTITSFIAAEWQPYGDSPGVVEFKKGRQLIHVYISSAPAKMGKTMIQVNPKLMAADVPLPPDAVEVRYEEAPAKLEFLHEGTWDDVAKFYQTEMPKLGWKPTSENLIKNEKDAFQIYRNPEKAFLEVKLETRSGKTVAEVEYKSPGQFEADEKLFKEAMEKKKAEAARKEKIDNELNEADKRAFPGKSKIKE